MSAMEVDDRSLQHSFTIELPDGECISHDTLYINYLVLRRFDLPEDPDGDEDVMVRLYVNQNGGISGLDQDWPESYVREFKAYQVMNRAHKKDTLHVRRHFRRLKDVRKLPRIIRRKFESDIDALRCKTRLDGPFAKSPTVCESCLIFELEDSEPLSKYMAQWGDRADYTMSTAIHGLIDGLQYLHSAGIAHNNITAETVRFRVYSDEGPDGYVPYAVCVDRKSVMLDDFTHATIHPDKEGSIKHPFKAGVWQQEDAQTDKEDNDKWVAQGARQHRIRLMLVGYENDIAAVEALIDKFDWKGRVPIDIIRRIHLMRCQRQSNISTSTGDSESGSMQPLLHLSLFRSVNAPKEAYDARALNRKELCRRVESRYIDKAVRSTHAGANVGGTAVPYTKDGSANQAKQLKENRSLDHPTNASRGNAEKIEESVLYTKVLAPAQVVLIGVGNDSVSIAVSNTSNASSSDYDDGDTAMTICNWTTADTKLEQDARVKSEESTSQPDASFPIDPRASLPEYHFRRSPSPSPSPALNPTMDHLTSAFAIPANFQFTFVCGLPSDGSGVGDHFLAAMGEEAPIRYESDPPPVFGMGPAFPSIEDRVRATDKAIAAVADSRNAGGKGGGGGGGLGNSVARRGDYDYMGASSVRRKRMKKRYEYGIPSDGVLLDSNE